MPRLVSVARAAKLVGISRGALQKKIHDRELESFEGQVKLDDIEKIFPDAELEDNHLIEDLEKIVEKALKRARGEKLAKLLAPDTHTLAARLHTITKDHARSKSQINELIALCKTTQEKIQQLAATSDKPQLFDDLNNWINDSIATIQAPEVEPTTVLRKDTVLRVVAAQVHLINSGHEFFVDGSNSILEAGLSAGLALNYGCSNGNCGKCKARLISGEIKKIKPHDYSFSEAEKMQNYFLCCSNTAITEVEIEADEAGSEKDIPRQTISAKVKKIDKNLDDVLILNLKTPRTKRLRFLAGQSVELSFGDIPALEIPIASCPCDDMNIQFHIPYDDSHPFISYVNEELAYSDAVHIKGPTGSFVLDEKSNNPVIFIAFDTGFAPIKSLIEHAVTLEHAEFIQLYWLHQGKTPYMHNQCRAWEDALDDFSYQHIEFDEDNDQVENKLTALIEATPDLAGKNIYICGSEKSVQQAEAFLQSHKVNSDNIKTQAI